MTSCRIVCHRLVPAILSLALLIPQAAKAVTFEEAALDAGYTYGSTGTINVASKTIDSLAGVNKFVAADTINVYDNQVSVIETNQFSTLTNLHTLGLSKNAIGSIPSNAFSGLVNLQDLRLSSNQITAIELDDFSGLTNLWMLELSGNHITDIEAGAFSSLTSLSEFSLAGNDLATIPPGVFGGLSSLEWLTFAANYFSSIQSGAFSDMMNLRGLALMSNGLTSLNLAGAQFAALQYLYAIEGNPITSVDMSDISLSDLAFRTVMGELDGGSVATMNLSRAHLSTVANLTPMGTLDDLVALDLGFAELPDLDEIASLVAALEQCRLDDLTLSSDQWAIMSPATRTALSNWDTGAGNTLTIVPEPASGVMLGGMLVWLILVGRRRARGKPAAKRRLAIEAFGCRAGSRPRLGGSGGDASAASSFCLPLTARTALPARRRGGSAHRRLPGGG